MHSIQYSPHQKSRYKAPGCKVIVWTQTGGTLGKTENAFVVVSKRPHRGGGVAAPLRVPTPVAYLGRAAPRLDAALPHGRVLERDADPAIAVREH